MAKPAKVYRTIIDGIVDIFFEDDLCIAFHEQDPISKTHFIVAPKDHMGMKSMVDAEDKHQEMLGHLMVIVAKCARDLGLTDGYRTVINNGEHGCQKIKSFYIQVFGN